jgi:phage tail-like protein
MPAPSTRNDPFKNFNFLVEIDGIAPAAFKSVSGLSAEVEVIEYRTGADALTSTRRLPGRVRYSNVTLTRGITTSRDLWDWWQTVVDGALERRDVSIALLDDARRPVLRWLLRSAWIAKIEGPELEAGGNEVAIESVVLTHEGLQLD